MNTLNLTLEKKKKIGVLQDGSIVYDYGSKFFAISDKNEILEKSIDLTSRTPFQAFDIIDCYEYEYLKDVSYTREEEYSISAVLDASNAFIGGYKVDITNNEINGLKYTYCTSVDIFDLEEDSEAYRDVVKACELFFDTDDISVLDEDINTYYAVVILNGESVIFTGDEDGERILSLNKNNSSEEMALFALKAEERLEFDPCSLLSLKEIEEREICSALKFINSITLNDVTQVTIAHILNMNQKSISASKNKEKYLELYKAKLTSMLLDYSNIHTN